jgi:hypothetical protein
MSILALGPTQCHILWIPGLFSRGEVVGYEANYSLQSHAKVKGQLILFYVNIPRMFGTEVVLNIYRTTL